MKKIYNLIIYTALSIQINAQILPDVKVTDNGTFNARVVDGVGEVSFLDYKNYVLKGSWLHSGNAGTNAATHFIGTTDAQPLVFKTNNVIRARLLVNDNNFFGINSGNLTGTGTNNNFFGNGTGANFTTGANNNFIGYLAGAFNTTGGNNNFLGSGAGYNNTTGSNNNFNGNGAGLSNISGGNNNFYGNNAGYLNTTGSDNNFIGSGAGYSNTTGGNNNFNGNGAGFRNTEGANNNFNGNGVGAFNTTGSDNNFIGSAAGRNNTTGSDNIIIGTNAGKNLANFGNESGNGNIYLGKNALGHNTNGSNQISINNLIYANEIQNVGIGIANPAEKLEVNGKAKINAITLNFPSTTSILNANMVAMTDATGSNLELKSFTDAGIWSTTGNSATNPTTNFLGTTDAQDLAFRTNNTERLRILSTGEVRAAAWGFTGNTTKITGSSNEIGLSIGNVQRATLDINNTFTVGTAIDNEYTSTFNLKSWNGVSGGSESFSIINSGTIGARYRVNTGRIHSFEVNGIATATINNIGIGIGTDAPTSSLHISKSQATVDAKIENTSNAISKLTLKNSLNEYSLIKTSADDGLWLYDVTNSNSIMTYKPLAAGYLLLQPQSGKIALNKTTPQSSVDIGGSISKSITTGTGTALTLNDTHYTLYLPSTLGAFSVTLPAANTCIGREYKIVNHRNATATISSYIDINGTAVTTMGGREVLVLQSTGTSWIKAN